MLSEYGGRKQEEQLGGLGPAWGPEGIEETVTLQFYVCVETGERRRVAWSTALLSTGSSLLQEAIEAIAESAFKTSPYPVILSFENHVDS